jgi:hypothetical protein
MVSIILSRKRRAALSFLLSRLIALVFLVSTSLGVASWNAPQIAIATSSHTAWVQQITTGGGMRCCTMGGKCHMRNCHCPAMAGGPKNSVNRCRACNCCLRPLTSTGLYAVNFRDLAPTTPDLLVVTPATDSAPVFAGNCLHPDCPTLNIPSPPPQLHPIFA